MNRVRENAWHAAFNIIGILLATTKSSLVKALIHAAQKMLEEAKQSEQSLDNVGNE